MNVNLGRGACPVCGSDCDFKLTKKAKVYVVCAGDSGCGSQVFARGYIADKLLRERIKAIDAAAGAEIPAEQAKQKAAPKVTITKHSSEGATVAEERTIFDILGSIGKVAK